MMEIVQLHGQVLLTRKIDNHRKEIVAVCAGPNQLRDAESIADADRKIELLTEALQLFTQAIGGPRGYIPSLGTPKTSRALELMKEAGVKPVYHD